MKSSKRDWSQVTIEWFRTADTDALREFVEALDYGMIKDKEHERTLKQAFDAECNRRSAIDYMSRNNGEWI